MKYRILVFLFLLLNPVWLFAQESPSPRFFAKAETTGRLLYRGDSVLVNIVLYANLPFHQVHPPKKKMAIKGGTARLLAQYGVSQQQQVRLDDGKFYFALLLQQYMVSSDEVGEISFPNLRYEASLGIYTDTSDAIDRFFGWSKPQLQRTIEVKTKLQDFKLSVQERPKRSTNEILRSGKQII